MRTVSSCPGAGMMGSLHTEHLGANFLKKEDMVPVILKLGVKVFVNCTSKPETCSRVQTHTHTYTCHSLQLCTAAFPWKEDKKEHFGLTVQFQAWRVLKSILQTIRRGLQEYLAGSKAYSACPN